MGFWNKLFGGADGDVAPEVKAGSSDPKEHFTHEVISVARSIEGVTAVARVQGQFALDITRHGDTSKLFLDNIFAETRDVSPEQRRSRIAFVILAFEKPKDETWEEARPLLFPVLRGATFGSGLDPKRPLEGPVGPAFVPGLRRLTVVDSERGMAYVGPSQLEKWNVGIDEVLAAASERFDLLRKDHVSVYDRTHGPLFSVDANDSYETSRLMIPGWLAGFASRVEGRPVAIVPERGTLLVGGDGKPAMLSRLLQTAGKEYDASTRRISPALYTVDDAGNVVPLVSHADPGLARQLAIAHAGLLIYEHGQQKRALDEAFAAQDRDVFVASYKVYERADGVKSVVVWTETVDSLLPRADKVMLLVLGANEAGPPARAVEVPFEAVLDRLTEEPGHSMPRFRTGAFPSSAELEALEKRFPQPQPKR